MVCTDGKGFVDQILPGIVAQAAQGLLSVLFTTGLENGMSGFLPPHDIELLTINLRTGPRFLAVDLFTSPEELDAAECGQVTEFIVQTTERLQTRGLPRLRSDGGFGIAVPDSPDEYALVFVYADEDEELHRLDQFARCVRGFSAQAKIVLVTCDCEFSRKRVLASDLQRNRLIDHLVVVRSCGGGVDMPRIARSLIGLWKRRFETSRAQAAERAQQPQCV